jgi:Bifunctional DNA primase/polymerase, N-terminal
MTTPTPAQGAMWFANRGHYIVPVHGIINGQCSCGDSDCRCPGKHPFTLLAPHGAKHASNDPAEVASWFAKHTWLNYGVRTDTFLVIDVDTKHDGMKKWADFATRPTRGLLQTWVARSGSDGRHFFFQAERGIRGGTLTEGIDIKTGEGSYVLGALSRHASGGTYDWEHQCAPSETALAKAPDWLLCEIETRTHLGKVRPAEDWRKLAREGLRDGTRHNEFMRLCGLLMRQPGLDPVVVRDVMLGWNLGRGQPPLPEKEVLDMVNACAERELRKDQWL